jgi:hypothetical protein
VAIIIASFADGPERCSGLPIVRYDPQTLVRTLGSGFELIESRRHDHVSPGDNTQRFQLSRFQRHCPSSTRSSHVCWRIIAALFCDAADAESHTKINAKTKPSHWQTSDTGQRRKGAIRHDACAKGNTGSGLPSCTF